MMIQSSFWPSITFILLEKNFSIKMNFTTFEFVIFVIRISWNCWITLNSKSAFLWNILEWHATVIIYLSLKIKGWKMWSFDPFYSPMLSKMYFYMRICIIFIFGFVWNFAKFAAKGNKLKANTCIEIIKNIDGPYRLNYPRYMNNFREPHLVSLLKLNVSVIVGFCVKVH